LQTIFSDDAIKSKRNTEAVDVGGNTLVSARVTEYRPAALEPLESVSNAIEKVLTRESAITQVGTVGQAQLDKLKKGEKVNLTWSAVRPLSRMHAPNLSAEARNAIFSVSTKKLPAYVGANAPGGFALYRIDSVKPFDSAPGGDVASRSQALRQHYGQVIAQEDLMGWLAALRQRYPVTINTAALERK
jgi:peptidyl-prolyl cis-trans isomerase D